MVLVAWGNPLFNGDHHYVRLIFTGSLESINPSIRFAIYDPNIKLWVTIPNNTSPTSGNTNHYITEQLPVDATTGTETIFYTVQSTLVYSDFLDELKKTGYVFVDSPETRNPDIFSYVMSYAIPEPTNKNAPSTIYFPVYWSSPDNAWGIPGSSSITYTDPFGHVVPPCFSEKSLLKILEYIKFPVVLIKSRRGKQKMFRVCHKILGELEFTDEHPFIYKNKTYSFKNLIKIHPTFKKKYSEIDFSDPQCGEDNYVYNFMIDPDQQRTDSIVHLDKNLSVLGLAPYNHFLNKLKKKLEIINTLISIGENIDFSAHVSNNVDAFIRGRETFYVWIGHYKIEN